MIPSPEYDLRLMGGPRAACLAPALWAALGPRERAAMLWDVERGRRAGLFPGVLGAADIVGVAWEGNAVSGMAWVTPLAPGARCGAVHFCFTRRERAERIARDFLARLADARRFESLVALLPAPYRHARAFARRVGFAELGRLPGACRLAGLRGWRVTPGVVLALSFEETHGNFV